VPAPPALRLRPQPHLTLQPSVDSLIGRDSMSSVSALAPVVVLIEPARKAVANLWAVRVLGADAVWRTTILPAATREIALPALTREVVVTAVSRTGIESPAARLTIVTSTPALGAGPR
jgi:hypothetical protein